MPRGTPCYRRVLGGCSQLNDLDAGLVIGYDTRGMTAIETRDLPADLAQRLPRCPATPAVLIGRLALDSRDQRRGLGTILLQDALRRALELSAFAVVVDAKDDRAPFLRVA